MRHRRPARTAALTLALVFATAGPALAVGREAPPPAQSPAAGAEPVLEDAAGVAGDEWDDAALRRLLDQRASLPASELSEVLRRGVRLEAALPGNGGYRFELQAPGGHSTIVQVHLRF